MSILAFLIVFLIAAFIAGCLADFIVYCIGAPSMSENGLLEAQNGRIFSRYGDWVARKYNALELARYNDAFNKAALLTFTDEEIEAKRNAIGKTNDAPPIPPSLIIANLREAEAKRIFRENEMRLNWWMPLGACPICFSFWIISIIGGIGLFLIAPYVDMGLSGHIIAALHFAPLAIRLQKILG